MRANGKGKPRAAELSQPRDEPAGPFSEWLHSTHRVRRLKVVGADVPCGTCNACCRASYFIHIRPEETDTLARIPKRLLFPAPGLPKGNFLMGHDANGRCPMLIDEQCSIYEVRPQTCRDFDCRIFAAAGIRPDEHGAQQAVDERVRAWQFVHPTEADVKEHAAVGAAGKFLTERADAFPDGVLPGNPVQLALLAVRVYRVFLRLEEASATGQAAPSPAEIARLILADLEGSAPPAKEQKEHSRRR
jgi:Fe-S-cluster containining protein